jgi:hypothetical protein
MGKMQRNKGATYERWCANKLRSVYPHAKRGIGQARSASEVPDVDGTPWWIELKHQQQPNLYAALTQATTASDGRSPLVIARKNKTRDVVVMYLDDFISMVSELAQVSTHAAFNPPGPALPHEVGPCPHCGGNYAECGPRLRTGRSCA